MTTDSSTTPLDFNSNGIIYSIDASDDSIRQYFVDDDNQSAGWVIISEKNV